MNVFKFRNYIELATDIEGIAGVTFNRAISQLMK